MKKTLNIKKNSLGNSEKKNLEIKANWPWKISKNSLEN